MVQGPQTAFTFAYPTQPSYGTVSTATGTVNRFRLLSYFGRLNYDLSDKYHLALSARTDASTRFADGNRWGTFYSVGASWNLNKESFMQNFAFLSDLKLKASYGTSGNQGLLGSFPYLATYIASRNIGSASGSVANTLANYDLSWESQKQLDIGMEFGLLRNRITGSFVYFRRQSEDLLFNRPLSPSLGFPDIADNTGGVENYGYEIELNTTNIRNRDLEWRTSFNLTCLKNKVTIVAPGTTQRKGGSWYDWYIQEYAGVDPADGLPMWYRDDPATGKKVTTKTYSQATRYYVGNRLADYTGGMTNFLKHKNFDLSVLISFSIGGKFYDVDYANISGIYVGYSSSRDIYKRWQSTSNPGDGKMPKLTTVELNGIATSTRFLFDATYARVRNITLGYTLPETILDRVFLKNARFFIDLQNPLTFFGGPEGTDPEAGINAQNGNNNTTTNKTFSVGISLGF